MENREEIILDAAGRVFLRYGVKRSTMNDIAEEAGLARQTLYNAFANKDEVVRGTIRLHTDRALAAIEAALPGCTSLGDKLDAIFTHMAVEPFEALQAYPHAEDVIDGFGQAGREEKALANERYLAVMRRVLEPLANEIEAGGQTVPELSRLVLVSAIACKHSVETKKELLVLLAALRDLVLRAAIR